MSGSVVGGLGDLATIRDASRGRMSSWDEKGGNLDFWMLHPGETKTLAELQGPGSVRHIWMTTMSRDDAYLRKHVLRMFWDGAETPCVEAPLGDFFGIGHGMMADFWSQPLTMSPRGGRGFNCFFPMPYQESGRIEITNEGDRRMMLYFYVDYETYDTPSVNQAHFHAQFRLQHPTDGWGRTGVAHTQAERAEYWQRPNLDGTGNYTILEALGRGHYVGCNLNIDVFERQQNDWYGEGDDMIWIDGELAIRGTGTEDYFNTAFSPETVFCTPYHGITIYQGTPEWPWSGKNSMYRFHIEDPIHFRESIKVTIEHGHANDLSNDYSSTAYWYQLEPHAPPIAIPDVASRLPR